LLNLPVEIESSVNSGTCFVVRVPPGRSENLARPFTAVKATQDAYRTGTVLVIDDDQEVADATAMLLEVLGFDVVVATGIEMACSKLLNGSSMPGLILCDFRLDGGDNGLDAIQSVRDTAQRCVPAILVSGDTSFAARETLQGVENCHLLSKPVDADELLERIDSVFAN